jgi:hemoglobin/transferrin/lactoferrin receptor protein
MKKIGCFLLLLLAGTHLNAQSLLVFDALEGEPLERAIVQVLTDNLSPLTTDDRGQVDISLFKASENIQISSLGYLSVVLAYTDLKQLGFKIGLQPAPMTLDQVVISAARWSQSSRELPYKIVALKTKSILLQAPQTSADLLATSGEVFIQKSQQGGGSPMIRGFATNRLLIAVDGIRMNNAIFRSGNLQQVISIDPLSVERTEIYFGPSSVIYGSDAIGGVMSFSTLRPELSSDSTTLVKGRAYSRFSSANEEFSQHIDFNVGREKWAWRSSISYNKYGDLRMGSKGSNQLLRGFSVERNNGRDSMVINKDPELQLNTGFSQFHTLQKIRYRPSTYWDIEYALHYSTTSTYDRYDRLTRTSNGLPRNAEWFYGPQIWMMNKLELNYRKANKLADKITLRAAWQSFEESRNDRDFGDTDLRTRTENVEAFSINLDLQKRLARDHKLFYGVEGIFNDVLSTASILNINTTVTEATFSRYPTSTWQSYAVYANHEWEWSEKLTSQLGARYNQFIINSDFTENLAFFPLPFSRVNLNKGNLTGSLGMVYRPSENWKWRINIGTAFRAPNVDDIGKIFDSGNDIVVVPNPDLEAEYAYNGELGLASLLGSQVKIDLSAYYTYLAKALVRRSFSLNGKDSIIYDGNLSEVQAVQNGAGAFVYGFQIGLDLQVSKNLTWRNQFNWQYGEEEDNAGQIGPSRHAAPPFGISRLKYNWPGIKPGQDLTMELNFQYSGGFDPDQLNFEERDKSHIYEINDAGEAFSPAWHSLNLKALYYLNDNWNFSLGLENITDQRYRPYSSGLVAPGMNLMVAVMYSF